MERTCSFCGKYFESYPEDKQRYCSEECHQKYLERQRLHHILKLDIHENCVFCGKKIEGKKRGTKYCSDFCRRKAREIKNGAVENHGELTKSCPVCGKKFKTWKSRKTCCSDECSAKRHNQSRILNPEQKAKRAEYDRQKYLKKHPDALTQEERSELARIRRELEAPDRERRKQEQKRREEKWARLKTEKEKKKQENIAHWLEYEAEHECSVCGKTYTAHYPLSKYCSKTCQRKATRIKKRYEGITVDRDINLKKLAKRDHDQCQICGLLVDWTDKIETDKTVICGDMYPSIDHKIPISLGGLHSWDNVKLAHRICNSRKSNKYIG